MTTVSETERKYSVPSPLPDLLARLEPLLAGDRTVGAPRPDELDAIYFDTADLRLVRSGVTLRRRSGGEDAGWHLKVPGGSEDTRLEIREPLTSGDRVPAALLRLLGGLTGGRPVGPVVRLRTERVSVEVRSDDRRSVAVLADDTVRPELLGGVGAPAGAPVPPWHEVEVEEITGDSAVFDELDAALMRVGAVRSPTPSKLARALGSVAATPLVPPPPEGRRDGPAAVFLTARLRTQVRALMVHDVAVRAQRDDAVHQMRVSVRRLRSELKTFARFFAAEPRRRARRELKWLGTALGAVRDAQVLRQRLADQLDALPSDQILGPVRLDLALRTRGDERTAQEELDAVLKSDRYLALLDDLIALAGDPPFTERAARPAGTALPRVVRREQKRLRALVEQATAAQGPLRDHLMHEARKQAKLVRYSVETLAPAWGAPADRLVELFKSMQDELGDRQDAVVARQILRAEGAGVGSRPAHNGYTYGLLVGISLAEAEQAERRFLKTWRRKGRRSELPR